MKLTGLPKLGLLLLVLASVSLASRQWGIIETQAKLEGKTAAPLKAAEAAKAKLPVLPLAGTPLRRGEKITAVEIQNSGRTPYDETNVEITFRTEEGEVVTLKRYWLRWLPGEAKTVYLEKPLFVEKISVEGIATQGRFEAQWAGAPPGGPGFDPRASADAYTQGAELAKAASDRLTRLPLEELIARQEQKVQSLQTTIVQRFETLKAREALLQSDAEREAFAVEAETYKRLLEEKRAEDGFLHGLTSQGSGGF